jgi:uncharacterized protein YqgC (DUF456 family)
MIWDIIVFIFGIYVGQEYNILPSIKLLFFGALSYLKTIQENNTETEPTNWYRHLLEHCGF